MATVMTSDATLPRLAVVAAVNKPEVLKRDLLASPMIAEERISLVVEENHPNASRAYNAGLSKLQDQADVVIFAHQDVYFPAGWEDRLLAAIAELDQMDSRWAVLGVLGTPFEGSRTVGRCWSSGIGAEVGQAPAGPTRVSSLDELVIVLRHSSGLRFDESLPNYHLYATDLVKTAEKAGLKSYVFDGPVIHNSEPVRKLDGTYDAAYHYMRRKWRSELPLKTPILPITRWAVPLYRRKINRWLGRGPAPRPAVTGVDDPAALARTLGYERSIRETV